MVTYIVCYLLFTELLLHSLHLGFVRSHLHLLNHRAELTRADQCLVTVVTTIIMGTSRAVVVVVVVEVAGEVEIRIITTPSLIGPEVSSSRVNGITMAHSSQTGPSLRRYNM